MKKVIYLFGVLVVSFFILSLYSCSKDDEEDGKTELLISLKDSGGLGVDGQTYIFPDGEYDETSFSFLSAFGSINKKNGETVSGIAIGSVKKNHYSTYECSPGRYYIRAVHFPESYSGIPRVKGGGTYATAIKNKSTVVEITVK